MPVCAHGVTSAPTAAIYVIAIGPPDSTLSRSPALFDQLVGSRQERLRHRDAERLGGLEVQQQLNFRD